MELINYLMNISVLIDCIKIIEALQTIENEKNKICTFYGELT